LPGPTRIAAQLETDMELTNRAYRNALDALEAGITYLRTVGDARHVDLAFKKAITAGQLLGPPPHCPGPAVIQTAGPRPRSEGCPAGLDCVEHGYCLDEPTVELMVALGAYLVPTLCVSRAEQYMRNVGCPQWMIDRSLRAGEDHLRAFQLAPQGGVRIAM